MEDRIEHHSQEDNRGSHAATTKLSGEAHTLSTTNQDTKPTDAQKDEAFHDLFQGGGISNATAFRACMVLRDNPPEICSGFNLTGR